MEVITTSDAPAAIGTYSQAVVSGNTVYISGQIPLDPVSGEVVSDEIRAQVEQVFNNLDAICRAAGGALSDVVKFTVYLTDLAAFPVINEVMAMRLAEPFPARAAIEVSALPRGVAVEVDAIMVRPGE